MNIRLIATCLRVLLLALAGVCLGGAVLPDAHAQQEIEPPSPFICEGQGLPVFCEMDTALPGVEYGAAAWGDYDNDGDLDLVLTGNTQGVDNPASITAIYENRGEKVYQIIDPKPVPDDETAPTLTIYETVYNRNPSSFISVWRSSVAWGDYDNDGDLDFVLSGMTDASDPIAQIYENIGQRFTPRFTLEGVHSGDVAWGDYDNDGDLDLVLTGITRTNEYRTTLYQNRVRSGGSFEAQSAGLIGLASSAVDWGDYDNDGDLDLLLTGMMQPQGFSTVLYHNEGNGLFVDAGVFLKDLIFADANWGDYDADGDLDIVLSGGRLSPFLIEGELVVYRNEGGFFSDAAMQIPGRYQSAAPWVDYDNDGDLDLLVSGADRPVATELEAALYRNDGGSFVQFQSFGGGLNGDAIWGDYDTDGDVDLLLLGRHTVGEVTTNEYRNEVDTVFTPLAVPEDLRAEVQEDDVTFSWQPPTDAMVATYNLRVGTVPGGQDIVSAMASSASGTRFLSARGNAGLRTEWTLRDLPSGTYFWSVQALDASFSGSAFADEQIVSTSDTGDTTPPAAPTAPTAEVKDRQVTLRWEANTEPDLFGYRIYRSTTPDTTVLLAGTTAGTERYEDEEVINGTTYYYRITAFDQAGNESAFSEEIAVIPQTLFTDLGITLIGADKGAVAWGDYDNDGDLDLLIAGPNSGRIYRNTDGVFSDTQIRFPGVSMGTAAWADYDADGDLDFIMSGVEAFTSNIITRIYHNDNGSFTDLGVANIPGLFNSVVAWGDYDNDGDLDLAISGDTTPNSGGVVTHIYRNDDGIFRNINAQIAGITNGTLEWGNIDGDQDLDLLVTGTERAQIAINRNQTLFMSGILELFAISSESVALGDYDNDGDLDLAFTGQTVAGTGVTRIYRDEGPWRDIKANLVPVTEGHVSWSDYDNDGDLDLLVSGVESGVNTMHLYRNDTSSGGGFTDLGNEGIAAIHTDKIVWGDYDNDGDLDLLTSSIEGTHIYRNDAGTLNTLPAAPEALNAEPMGAASVTLQWAAASDAETPAAGLTYNLRVGTAPGRGDIMPPLVVPGTEQRLLPARGNVGHSTAWILLNLAPGTYFWSVQTLDTGLASSPFAPEQTFTISGSAEQ